MKYILVHIFVGDKKANMRLVDRVAFVAEVARFSSSTTSEYERAR